VENFPGFPEGIHGPALVTAMQKQALRFGTRVVSQDIVRVDLKQTPFALIDDQGHTLRAHAIIIATGASANYLGLESEAKFKNRGVSACAVCDGALPRFRDKDVVVVGGGDSAAEEGTHLAKFASRIYLVHRRDRLRASPIMAQRLLGNPKVTPVWNSTVTEVLGDEHKGLTGVVVKDIRDGRTRQISAAGMFVAIGHTPNTAFLQGQIQLNPQGFVVLADPFRTTTNVEGVFAAGDVADPTYKQAITAAGMGCKAALDAERWLAVKGIH
jgi:thioredoxin reductase (NADPH)